MSDVGKFTMLCSNRPEGVRESCGKVATKAAYGMFRCDDHVNDLYPCFWDGNLGPDGKCRIDHEKSHRIYGDCHNPRQTESDAPPPPKP
jgi:hypothetical protein